MKFIYNNLSERSRNLALEISHILLIFVAVLLLPPILSAASLRIEGNRAWLKADGKPLAEVLQLFEQRGAEVFIDPSVQQHIVSGDWENVEVGWLIGQLATPYSHMLEWKKNDNNGEDRFQISSIRIFPEGNPPRPHPLFSQGKMLDIVVGENGVKYLRGEIIVGFSQESSIEHLNALLNSLNGTVIEVIDPPGIYRLKLNDDMPVEEAVRIAQAHDGVQTTEPNLAFPAIASNILALSEVSEGMNLNLLPGETAIAVLDSGLDPAYVDYPFIRGTYDAVDPTAEISDPTGHGTLATLVAAGAVTPIGTSAAESGVPVIAIRAFDENGMTSSDTILRALNFAANSEVSIVSMSWGSEVPSRFLESAMALATQKGITLYAAAGNEPTGEPVYPAGYDSVIAVGGLNPDGSRWQDSNYGDFVERYEPALANFNNQSYAGTSISTPYAAFRAAQEAAE